jgi:hypothetical protein
MRIAECFAQSDFARFVNSPTGQLARVVAGSGLVARGFAHGAGPVLMVIALVPLVAGAFDLCLISALLGGPIAGARVREAAQ